MNKVTFASRGFRSRTILVNGQPVGRVDSAGSEVWAYLTVDGKDEFMARFKYHRPAAVATYTIRNVLERRTPQEVLEAIKAGRYIVVQLKELGIPHFFAREGAHT